MKMELDENSFAKSAMQQLGELFSHVERMRDYQPFSDDGFEDEASKLYDIQSSIIQAMYFICAKYYKDELEFEKEEQKKKLKEVK